jgi:hypothetical protein
LDEKLPWALLIRLKYQIKSSSIHGKNKPYRNLYVNLIDEGTTLITEEMGAVEQPISRFEDVFP